MFISGIIKFFIGVLGGLVSVIFLLISLFKRKKRGKLKIAAISFLGSILLILIVTLVELFLFPTNKKTDQLILVAYREAPIGGIWLGLYDDETWELGYSSREITSSGNYIIQHDTLTINAQSGKTILKDITETSFIIGSKNLLEIENSGIRSLEILMNKSGN